MHRPPKFSNTFGVLPRLFEVGPLTRAWLQHTELSDRPYDDTRKKKKNEQVHILTENTFEACKIFNCYMINVRLLPNRKVPHSSIVLDDLLQFIFLLTSHLLLTRFYTSGSIVA